MQRRKIIVNNDTYETLEAVRMTFRNASRKGEVSDDLILMAAFSALAEKMYNGKRKKEDAHYEMPKTPIMHDPVGLK